MLARAVLESCRPGAEHHVAMVGAERRRAYEESTRSPFVYPFVLILEKEQESLVTMSSIGRHARHLVRPAPRSLHPLPIVSWMT
jgi:hypothetical protein